MLHAEKRHAQKNDTNPGMIGADRDRRDSKTGFDFWNAMLGFQGSPLSLSETYRIAPFQREMRCDRLTSPSINVLMQESNDVSDTTTNGPTSYLDTEAVKLQPETIPINRAQSTEAMLAPNAARAVLPGESAAEFDALVEAVREFWQPSDLVERLLMDDFIQAEWELRRLRR